MKNESENKVTSEVALLDILSISRNIISDKSNDSLLIFFDRSS